MRKMFLFMLIIILSIMHVKADSSAHLSIDCKDNYVEQNSNVTCDVSLVSNKMFYSKISFNIDSNLDADFKNSVGILEKKGNNITLKFDEKVMSSNKDEIYDYYINYRIGTISFTMNNSDTIKFSNIFLTDINENTEQLNEVEKTVNIIIDDLLLSSLEINGKKIELNDKSLEYLLSLDKTIDKTNIIAKAKSDKLKIEYENIDLNPGLNNLKIKVTDKKDNIIEYSIKIIKLDDEKYPKFNRISIQGHEIAFDINKYSYDLNLEEHEKNLDIKIDSDGVLSKIIDNDDLSVGSKVKVIIYDDGATRIYSFNIREKNNEINKSETKKYALYYVFFGISIFIFIISIIYSLKIKRRRELLK